MFLSYLSSVAIHYPAKRSHPGDAEQKAHLLQAAPAKELLCSPLSHHPSPTGEGRRLYLCWDIADVLGSVDVLLVHQASMEHASEGDLTLVEPTYCWAGIQRFAYELVTMNWKCFPPVKKCSM